MKTYEVRYGKFIDIFGWDSGELYISSGAAGMSTADAIMCCSYDGVRCVKDGNFILVPEKWAREERPDRSKVFDAIRRTAEQVRSKHPTG